jgi:hypothetical protein
LSVEQQNILKTFLTSSQLEEVRLQMMANLANQEQERIPPKNGDNQEHSAKQDVALPKNTTKEEGNKEIVLFVFKICDLDDLTRQLKIATAKSAQLENDLKKHEQEMKSMTSAPGNSWAANNLKCVFEYFSANETSFSVFFRDARKQCCRSVRVFTCASQTTAQRKQQRTQTTKCCFFFFFLEGSVWREREGGGSAARHG